jgi:hypothetical protein
MNLGEQEGHGDVHMKCIIEKLVRYLIRYVSKIAWWAFSINPSASMGSMLAEWCIIIISMDMHAS